MGQALRRLESLCIHCTVALIVLVALISLGVLLWVALL